MEDLRVRPLSLAFSKLADIALALGATPLTKHPGCWEHELPGGWAVTVNGRSKVQDGVPPFSALLLRRGMPAGIINPYDGTFVGDGEESFLAACEEALASIVSERNGEVERDTPPGTTDEGEA